MFMRLCVKRQLPSFHRKLVVLEEAVVTNIRRVPSNYLKVFPIPLCYCNSLVQNESALLQQTTTTVSSTASLISCSGRINLLNKIQAIL